MAKVIIVTGASRGIGLAITQFLLKEKHNVIVVARTKEALDKIKSQHPEQVEVLSGDLSDLSFGSKAVDLAVQKFNRLDGLVINHGVLAPVERVSNTSAEQWRKAFDINFFSAISLVQSALPQLKKNLGKIVFVSSGAAVGAYSGWGAYGASKAALNHLALTLSVEEPDITSIAIRPGTVDTEMQRELREIHHTAMDAKDAKKFASLKAEGQLLRPEQPGNVIARLVLAGKSELNGKFLTWSDKLLGEYQDK